MSFQPSTALRRWHATKVSARRPMSPMDAQSRRYHLGSLRKDRETLLNQGLTRKPKWRSHKAATRRRTVSTATRTCLARLTYTSCCAERSASSRTMSAS